MRQRVFSGARPTGRQHLGNYHGAIENYVALQDDYECFYCIVDVHALTSLEETHALKEYTIEMMLDWLAAGLDPERSVIFVQSHVPQVMELSTLLGMVTPLGWLTRVTTFKEKARSQPENINYGLVGYPVLMTADIILYKAEVVPVGEDQIPHLELAREIVRRFNRRFGDTFPEPYAYLTEAPLILGLDGERKMSKTYDNHIELAASPEDIHRRVMSAVTDPARVYRTDLGHPEVCNIFSLHGIYSPEAVGQIEGDCRAAAIGCVDCKAMLAKNIADALAPFRERRQAFAQRLDMVEEILREGARRASVVATETLTEVKDNMGLWR